MPDTPPPAAPSPEGVDPLIRQAHDFAELVESGRELVPWNYGDIAYVLRTLATRLSVPAVAPEGREAGVLVETLRRRVPLTEEINQWEGDDIDFTWWQASATGYNEALDAVLAALRTPPPVPPSGGVSEAMVVRITGNLLIDCEGCTNPKHGERFYDAMARELRSRLAAALPPADGDTGDR